MVHARGPFPVHDAALCEGHGLHRHGVDDAQEQHSQVQTAQDVAQVLRCRPAYMPKPLLSVLRLMLVMSVSTYMHVIDELMQTPATRPTPLAPYIVR